MTIFTEALTGEIAMLKLHLEKYKTLWMILAETSVHRKFKIEHAKIQML